MCLMMSLDDVSVGDDLFADPADDYDGFWNCFAYTRNNHNYNVKIQTVESFCSACKVTVFDEFLLERLLLIDKKNDD